MFGSTAIASRKLVRTFGHLAHDPETALTDLVASRHPGVKTGLCRTIDVDESDIEMLARPFGHRQSDVNSPIFPKSRQRMTFRRYQKSRAIGMMATTNQNPTTVYD